MPKKKTKRVNGEGTVFFDKSKNRWVAQIFYHDVHGEKKRKSFYGKIKSEALIKKNDFLETGVVFLNTSDTTTIPELLEVYVAQQLDMNIIQKSTYTSKRNNIDIIRRNVIGGIPVQKITEQDIIFFYSQITKFSNSIINKVVQLLKKAFAIAIEKDLIMKSPMQRTDLIKPRSVKPDKKVEGFTMEEQAFFLKCLDKEVKEDNCKYYLQFLIELYSGLRMGEINALSIDDIDFANNVVNVNKTISRGSDKGKGYETYLNLRPKTDNGVRKVPICKSLKKALELAVAQYVPGTPHRLLFYHHDIDAYIRTSTVNNELKSICDRNGLKFNGQHMLRHTFATRCIESGVQAEVLRLWLGHADISTTVNTYCDVFNNLHNDSISKLDSYYAQNFALQKIS